MRDAVFELISSLCGSYFNRNERRCATNLGKLRRSREGDLLLRSLASDFLSCAVLTLSTMSAIVQVADRLHAAGVVRH